MDPAAVDPAAAAVLAAAPRLGAVRLVAVDGPSGSGKTTFSGDLVAALRGRGARVALVPTDDFATWDDPVGWWPRLAHGVLDRLAQGRPGAYRRMDWSAGEPRLGATVHIEPPDVLLVEGVSSGRRSAVPLLSHLFWCEVPDPAVRLARAVARDGHPSEPLFRRWQLFEEGWFAVDGTGDRASTRVQR
uniref:uridine kinase family protein n=1 Tax=Actinokineospora spheciospongiae TaxID=909613 RepID=UPI001F1E3F39|nr:uridine kinase [Actinokineospora spheciospongiae]